MQVADQHPTRFRDCRILGAVGLLLAVLYGVLDIDFGKGPIPSAEAWRLGVAQPYVFSGLLLLALAVLMNRGVTAVRWIILIWCPLTIGGGIFWANSRGVVVTSTFEWVFLVIPVSVFWIWVVRRMFFARPVQQAADKK